MIKRHFLTLYISFLGLTSLAQETNVFLDRKFWKQNPSIETIKSYIEKGNDPTELNPNLLCLLRLMARANRHRIVNILKIDSEVFNHKTT